MRKQLAYTQFELDENTHIKITKELATDKESSAALIRCCPAGVYKIDKDGELTAEYAGCLECGTCLQIAPAGTLYWHYPNGGYGVNYRQG